VWRMVGQRAVAERVAESRPRGALAGPAERAGRQATGGVSPPPAVRVPVMQVPAVQVPVMQVKAAGLAAGVPRELPPDLRRGFRRPTGRAGRAARLPPKDLAGPATLAARHPVPSRAGARPPAMVKEHASRLARRARARRERALLTAGHAPAGALRETLREPLPMVMSGAARRPARLGHRRGALPVTGPGPRGRTDPGRRAAETANVTAAGRQIATSDVVTAVRLRVVVPAVRTATTALQRATGRVVSAAGMAPHMTAASVLTTAASHATGVPPVTGVRDRILLIGRPAGAVRMARPRDLPAVGPGTARRDATPAMTAPRRRPVGVTATAGRNVRPPAGSGPDRGTEAAPEAR
jgi:hypothetical protein